MRSRWLDIGQTLFCVSIDRHGVEARHTCTAILTEQALSIKDLLFEELTLYSYKTQRVISSRQDSTILPARVANHKAGFGLSCWLTELTRHMIKTSYAKSTPVLMTI